MTSLYSISELFEKRIFRIPDYQRGFSWGERQLEDFWKDLEKLPFNKIHYTGLLTIEKVKIDENIVIKWSDSFFLFNYSNNYFPYYIVDGQQRITSIIILISTILEKLKETEILLKFTKEELLTKYIFITKPPNETYIFGYEKEDPSYEFLKEKILKNGEGEPKNELQTLYTTNLKFAKNYFIEKLKHLSKYELEMIFSKLTNNLKFNLYEVDEELDVYMMFETMNNRGKPLSKLELLKNRLIYLTTLLYDSENEINNVRNKINLVWKTIYTNLGKNKNFPLDDDDFLKAHTYMYFGYMDDSSEMYSDYLFNIEFTTARVINKNLLLTNIEDYILNLQKSIKIWFIIKFPSYFNNDINEELVEPLEKINRLKYAPFEPNIMAALLKNPDNKEMLKLLNFMERYIFLAFNIYNSRSHVGKNYFYAKANELFKGGISITDLLGDINRRIKDDTKELDITKAIDYFKGLFQNSRGKGFYVWKGIHYFLFEYEKYLQGNEINKVLYNEIIKNNKSIEHIYPQDDSRDEWQYYFEKYSFEQKEFLKNTLGNLLLLKQGKNIRMSNWSFQKKKKSQAINNPGKYIGYFNGSYSEIEVSGYEDWTAKEILERGIKMLNFLEEKWDISFRGFKNKKKLLGLDFLKIEEHELDLN